MAYKKKRRHNTSNLGSFAQKKSRIVSPSESDRAPSNTGKERQPVVRELRMLHNDYYNRKEREVTSDVNLSHGNRIVPFKSLKDEIENNLCCRKCAKVNIGTMLRSFAEYCDNDQSNSTTCEKLEKFLDTNDYNPLMQCNIHLSEETVGIATRIRCNCEKQGLIFNTNVERTNYHGNKRNYNSYESYGLNCMLVMAMQQVGGSSTEADRLLSFLDHKHLFPKHPTCRIGRVKRA